MRYVSSKEAKCILQINATTLKSWKNKGIISFKKLSDKKYLYDVDSILNKKEDIKRKHVIYGRVSNTKQSNDLNTQIVMIKSYCISHGILVDEIYKDIASGMNENRKDFNLLLDEVLNGNIDTQFIFHLRID